MPFHIPENILVYSIRLTFSKNEGTCRIHFYSDLSTPDNVTMNSLGLTDCQSESS